MAAVRGGRRLGPPAAGEGYSPRARRLRSFLISPAPYSMEDHYVTASKTAAAAAVFEALGSF